MKKTAVRFLARVLALAILLPVIPCLNQGYKEKAWAAEEAAPKLELDMGSIADGMVTDTASGQKLAAPNVIKGDSGFVALGDMAFFNGTPEAHIEVQKEHPAYNFKRWDHYTASMWIKPETIKWSTLFASYKEGQPFDTAQVYLDGDGTVRAEIYGYTKQEGYSASTVMISNTKLKAGNWAHIAFVREGRSYTLYINGKEDASYTFSEDVYSVDPSGLTPVRFLIGGRCDSQGAIAVPYHGYMDEFKVYDTSLSQESVASMVNEAQIVPVLHFSGSAGAPESKLSLWYHMPAVDWEMEALPLGNGYMGSKIFGGVEKEVIQFNDITLWKGGPGSGDNPFGLSQTIGDPEPHLNYIRQLIDEGKPQEAQEYLKANMLGPDGDNGYGSYQNFGEVHLDFNLAGAHEVKDYRRELDIENAVSRVEYQMDGVNYKREYFMSYPDKVMVMKLTADQPMKLDVSQWSAHTDATDYINTAEGDTITVSGALKDNGERFASQLKVLSTDGTTEANNEKIQVSGAKELVLLLSTQTDYSSEYPVYRSGIDPMIPLKEKMNAASQKDYAALYRTHIEDYKGLFDRVQLDLGNEKPQIPTDELIKAYQYTPTRPLEVLFYQYGRYLLIASSRPGSLPANLQGIWNHKNTPIWGSDYHYNVNFQMNYWPAEVANLKECAEPMIDFIEALVPSGRQTAKTYYGVGDGTSPLGWSVNCTGNIFGYTTVGTQLSWGWSPAGNAFVSQNLWEHFDFNRDTNVLADQIYPVIKEAALFWKAWLIEDTDGTLVSTPSYSPEQMHIAKAPAYDQQLAWELFTNVIEASEILGVDEDLRQELTVLREKLSPIQTGSLGQIMEWKDYLTDTPGGPGLDGEPRHRHLSNLMALYPGKQINRDTPQWLEAASVSLDRRGNEKEEGKTNTTGWSTAWKINARARTFEGDLAHRMLSWQLATHVANNLWDTHDAHNIFQIEGNFGATSGVSEMLLQSHMDYIDLLPALPRAWACGSVSGLRARGAYTVDQSWNDGKLTNAVIYAENDGTVHVRSNDFLQKPGWNIMDSHGAAVAYSLDNKIMTFEGKAGETYTINTTPEQPFSVRNTVGSGYFIKGNPFTCTTELANHSGALQKTHMFLAVYKTNEDGSVKLDSISMNTAEVADGEVKEFALTQTIPNDESMYEIKSFVWEADTYKPVLLEKWLEDPVKNRISQSGSESITLPVDETYMTESGIGSTPSIQNGVFVGWSNPVNAGNYHTVSWNVHVETAGFYLPEAKIGSDGQSMLTMTADTIYRAYTPLYGKGWAETDYSMGIIYLPAGDYKIEMERSDSGWAGQFRDITLNLVDQELAGLMPVSQESDGRFIIRPGKDHTADSALLKGNSVHDSWRILLYGASTAVYKIDLKIPQKFKVSYAQTAGDKDIPLNITAHVLGSGKMPAVTTTDFTGAGEWAASACLTGGILDLSDAEPGTYYVQINHNSTLANIMDGNVSGSGIDGNGIVFTPVPR